MTEGKWGIGRKGKGGRLGVEQEGQVVRRRGPQGQADEEGGWRRRKRKGEGGQAGEVSAAAAPTAASAGLGYSEIFLYRKNLHAV